MMGDVSAEWMRVAMEESPVGMAVVGRVGRGWRIGWCNGAFCEGMPQRGAMVGRDVEEVFGGETGRAMVELIERAARGASVRAGEFAVTRAGVTTYWDLKVAALARGAAGGAAGQDKAAGGEILIHMHNMTDEIGARRQAEKLSEALREAHERWEMAVRGTEDGIWDWDVARDTVYWSPRAKEMLGYSDGEMQPTREVVREMIHTDDRARAWAEVGAQMRGTGDHYRSEYRLRHKDGGYRWVLARGLIVRDAEGNARRVVGSHVDITQRRKDEEILRQSREQLLGIINNSPAMIFVKDVEGVYRLVNRPFEHAANMGEVVGKRDADLFDAATVKRLQADDQAVMASRKPRTIEETIEYSGKRMTFLTTKFPLLDPEGVPYGVCGIATEVTALKEAEVALRDSEKLMRVITDTLPALIAYVDQEEKYVFNNKAYETWVKIPQDRLRGLSLKDMGTAYEKIAGRVKRALAGEAVNFQEKITYPDGVTRHVDVTYSPDIGEKGEVRGFAVMVNDVSALRQTEEALRSGQERLRLALEAADLALWEIDLTTGEVNESDRLIALFGLPPGTRHASSLEWSNYVHAEDLARVTQEYEAAVRGKGDLVSELRLVGKDGITRWVSMRGHVVRGADGVGVRMVGVCADITRQKTAQGDLERAKETAEAASRAKDRFLAVLSHELRTPLTPVVMSLAALDMDENMPAAAKQDLAMIRRNIELETQLIDDLLDVTRIAHGKLRLSPRQVRVHELLQHVLTICAAESREKGVALAADLRAQEDGVLGDPARLEQVFWNLVKNAIKFTPGGGRVEIASVQRDGAVEVCVRDTGVGIDAEAKDRIFNAFEQGEQTVTRTFGGLGLGLAISKAIVELHAGKIRVESEGRGKGAAFIVQLPLAASGSMSARPDPAPRMNGHATGARPAEGVLRVLVVDDHADTLRVMERLLVGMGMRVRTAGGVRSALAVLETEAIDLMISDIGLPDGTGLELMGEARRRVPGLRAIALSGFGMDADQRRSAEAGFQAHLTKPIGVDRLELAIREAMGT